MQSKHASLKKLLLEEGFTLVRAQIKPDSQLSFDMEIERYLEAKSVFTAIDQALMDYISGVVYCAQC